MKKIKFLTTLTAVILLIAAICPFCNAEELIYDTSVSGATLSLSARSAILIEADTGTVLYAKNEKEHRAIASTTKIMTALLTIEAGNLDEKFTADPVAIRVEGTSMGLCEGDIVTRRALCYGMLLPSGNDAANAAAINVSGTYEEFAKLMNRKAKALGMNDSSFVTPSGLDADNQYSCAYDMALLTAYALKNQTFREICCKSSAKVSFGNPESDRWMKNSNKLLTSYPGCIGVKTGFTDNARRTLVSAAERDGVTLIAVTLNAPNDWQDHTQMLDYGFKKVKQCQTDFDCTGIKIPMIGADKDHITVKADKAGIPLTDSQLKSLQSTVHLPKFLYGEVSAGEKIGEIQYSLSGKTICTVPVTANESCNAISQNTDIFTAIFLFIRKLFLI